MVYKTGLLILFAFTLNAQIMLNPNRSGILNPPAGGGGAYVTDNLLVYYDDEDYANGAVDTLFDKASSVDLYPIDSFGDIITNPDTSEATMTASGLTFDGNDYYGGVVGDVFTTGGWTIEMVVQIQDSTPNQYLAAWRYGSRLMTVGLINGKLACRGAEPGDPPTTIFFNTYATPLVDNMVHLIISSDGDTEGNIYVNNSLATPVAGENASNLDNARIFVGSLERDSYAIDGTIIRLVRIYDSILDSDERTQNYNSDSVQGKLE